MARNSLARRTMRVPSFTARAIITVAVATTVVAGAVASVSPALGQSAPAAPAGITAAPSTDAAESSAPASTGPGASASVTNGPRVDRVDIGDPVDSRWFAADDTSLWVHGLTSLVRVDLATSAITGRIPMYIEYGYDATGAGSVWQSDFDNDVLLRIDPVTDTVVKSIPVGSGPEGIAVTADAVWVAERHDGAVTRVDPATNTVVATIPVGPTGAGGPQQLTVGPNSVYVSVENAGKLVRIDPATNAVGFSLPLGPVASDGTEVWMGVDAGSNGKPQVVRIDPVSGATITAVDLDTSSIGWVAVGLGSVWAATDSGLLRIDPATGQILETVDLGGAFGDLLVAGGAVWVATGGQSYVLRIAP